MKRADSMKGFYRNLRNLQIALNATQTAFAAVQGSERQVATVLSNQAGSYSPAEDESGISFDTEVASQLLAQSADAFSRLSSMINSTVR